jgi:hypothetical protein
MRKLAKFVLAIIGCALIAITPYFGISATAHDPPALAANIAQNQGGGSGGSRANGANQGVFGPRRGEKINLAGRLDPKNQDPNTKWVFAIWRMMIGIVNIAVVILVIVVALATILHWNIDTYGFKKAIPSVIVAVVLANFSLLIVRGLVDLASILTLTLAGEPAELAKGLVAATFGASATTIGEVMGSTVGGIIQYPVVGFLLAPIALAGILVLLLGAIILVFIPALLVGVLAFLLWIRVAVILVFAAVSPLAFMALALPATQMWFRKWWSVMLNWIFMAPAVFLLLRIAASVGEFGAFQNPGATFVSTLLPFIIALGCLWFAIQVPFKMGGAVMATWGRFGNYLIGNRPGGWSRAIVEPFLAGAAKFRQERFLKTPLGKLQVAAQEYAKSGELAAQAAQAGQTRWFWQRYGKSMATRRWKWQKEIDRAEMAMQSAQAKAFQDLGDEFAKHEVDKFVTSDRLAKTIDDARVNEATRQLHLHNEADELQKLYKNKTTELPKKIREAEEELKKTDLTSEQRVEIEKKLAQLKKDLKETEEKYPRLGGDAAREKMAQYLMEPIQFKRIRAIVEGRQREDTSGLREGANALTIGRLLRGGGIEDADGTLYKYDERALTAFVNNDREHVWLRQMVKDGKWEELKRDYLLDLENLTEEQRTEAMAKYTGRVNRELLTLFRTAREFTRSPMSPDFLPMIEELAKIAKEARVELPEIPDVLKDRVKSWDDLSKASTLRLNAEQKRAAALMFVRHPHFGMFGRAGSYISGAVEEIDPEVRDIPHTEQADQAVREVAGKAMSAATVKEFQDALKNANLTANVVIHHVYEQGRQVLQAVLAPDQVKQLTKLQQETVIGALARHNPAENIDGLRARLTEAGMSSLPISEQSIQQLGQEIIRQAQVVDRGIYNIRASQVQDELVRHMVYAQRFQKMDPRTLAQFRTQAGQALDTIARGTPNRELIKQVLSTTGESQVITDSATAQLHTPEGVASVREMLERLIRSARSVGANPQATPQKLEQDILNRLITTQRTKEVNRERRLKQL